MPQAQPLVGHLALTSSLAPCLLGPFAPTSHSAMGETVRLPPNAEEKEGHVVQSAALVRGHRRSLGTANPCEEQAGFGENADDGNLGPFQEFTAQSTEGRREADSGASQRA